MSDSIWNYARRNGFVLLGAALLSLPLSAANDSWTQSGTADWHQGANWSLTTPPGAADVALIRNGGTAVIAAGSPLAEATNVYVDTGGLIISGTLSNSGLSYIAGASGTKGTVEVNGSGAWNTTGILYVGTSTTGILNIKDNGLVTGTDIRIGDSANGQGLVTISGSGVLSPLTHVYVGNRGSGTLQVTGNGAVRNIDGSVGNSETARGVAEFSGSGLWDNSRSLYIGRSGSSAGTLIVTEDATIKAGTVSVLGGGTFATGTGIISGGRWESPEFRVGDSGTGILQISGSGKVIASTMRIGNNATGIGSAIISGSGALLADGSVVVGNSGIGSLALNEYATGSSAYVNIGSGTYASGTMTITDNAAWTSSAYLRVGASGTGVFRADKNATVSVGELSVGNSATTAYGTVTITDTAVVRNSGNTYVGNLGAGSITISQSGTVENVNAYVGYGATGTGVALVTDDAVWKSSGQFHVAYHNRGELIINKNATVSNDSTYVGYYADGVGSISVENQAALETTGLLLVAGYGSGSMSVTGNGRLASNDARIANYEDSDGVIVIKDNAIWTSSGSIYVGNFGTGRLLLSDNARVSSDGPLAIGHSGTGTLLMSDNAFLENGNGVIGSATGALGHATLTSGTWINNGYLYIGGSGTGTLALGSTAIVTSGEGRIGNYATGEGRVDIADTALWENTGNLYIGNHGAGTLTLSESGTVKSNHTYIGYQLDSNGAVTISDTAVMENTGNLYLGGSGTGTLDITGSGAVRVVTAHIGDAADGTAVVTMGSNAVWISSSMMHIGNYGTGTFTLADTASVENDSAYIGSGSGGHGTVVITDTATWDSASNLYIGNSGVGNLRASGSAIINSAYGRIGINALGSGTVVITDHAKWINSSELRVGSTGTGSLLVNQNGYISSGSGFIGTNPGSSGTVAITDSATWNNAGNLYVSNNGGGDLDISGAAVVTTSGVFVGNGTTSNGSLAVRDSGTFISNDLRIGVGGTGSLLVNGNGHVSSTIGYIGHYADASGTVTITDSATWNNAGNLYLGNEGNATLDIDGASRVTTAGAYVGNRDGSDGKLTVGGTGLLDSGTILVIGMSGNGAMLIKDSGTVINTHGHIGSSGYYSAGRVDVIGGAWINTEELTVGGRGSGTLSISGSGFVQAGTVSLGTGALGTGAGRIELHGTVLETGKITGGAGSSILYSNSGTLRATGSNDIFLDGAITAEIDTGGLFIESSGHTLGTGTGVSFTGAGALTKNGGGSLTLSGSSSYGGGTWINDGDLILKHASATGSGTVTMAAGSLLELNFNGTYANQIVSSNTVKVTGDTVTISGSNDTLTGAWEITGAARVTQQQNLGDTADVNLDGGKLTVEASSWNWDFSKNKLDGDGLLQGTLGTGTFAFIGANAGSFTGTLNMAGGYFQFDDAGATALANAALQLSAGGSTAITQDRAIRGLNLDGGVLVLQSGSHDFQVPDKLAVTDLVAGSGTVQVVKSGSWVVDDTVQDKHSFFDQSGTLGVTLVSAVNVTGTGVALDIILTDTNGNIIGGGTTGHSQFSSTVAVTNSDGHTVGNAYYDFYGQVAADGIHGSYGLTELNAASGTSIVLANTGSSSTLNAKLSGAGGFDFSGTGVMIVGHASSDYEGATAVQSGTVRFLADNAFGDTSLLQIATGAAVDMAGNNQSIGILDTKLGSTLDLNSGALTITAGGTSAGSLAGGGQLNVDAGLLDVLGANAGLTANIDNSGTLRLDNTAGLGAGGTLANTGLVIWNAATGTLSKTLAGSGNIQVNAGSDILLAAENTTLGGTLAIDNTSKVTGTSAANIGAAALAVGGTFVMANDDSWTFANDLSGAGNFIKTASGTLFITHSNSFTGTTTITDGELMLGVNGALGAGAVINNAALDISAGITAFDNTISGTGSNTVSATGVRIGGTNTAFTGAWNITGSGTITKTENLGANSSVNIDADGDLSLVASGSHTWGNKLTGGGLLSVSLSGTADAFAFNSTTTGGNFAGTVALANSAFTIDSSAESVLALATLRLGANNVTSIAGIAGSGTRRIGGVTFSGGRMRFDQLEANATQATTLLKVDALDIQSGEIQLGFKDPSLIDSGTALDALGGTPLLAQDDGHVFLKLIESGSPVTGNAQNIALRDEAGNLITDAQTRNLSHDGITTDAVATYDYTASTGDLDDGLYLAYGLTQLDLQNGRTLVLDGDDGTDNGSTLSARVTGSGNLAINATDWIMLNGASNNYTGTTTVRNGTLVAGADNALGQTAALILESGAAFNLNDHAQTVGAFTGATSSTLALGSGGSLRLTQNSVSSGALAGDTGSRLAIGASSTLTVHGANADLHAAITLESGAAAWLDNTQALGDGALHFTDTTARLTLSNVAAGVLANELIGGGHFVKDNTGVVTIERANTAYTGAVDINDGALVANRTDSLGAARSLVNIASGARYELSGATGTLANTITGSGTLSITNGSQITIAHTGAVASTNAFVVNNAGVVIAADGLRFGRTTLDNALFAFAADGVPRTAGIAQLEGAGSIFAFNVDLDKVSQIAAGRTQPIIGAGTAADHLSINDSSSGIFGVRVTGTGSAPIGGSSIELITFAGTGANAATFHLVDTAGNPVDAVELGLSEYTLAAGNGNNDKPDGNIWYLADTGPSNAADAIVSTAAMMGKDWNLAMDSLHQRLGDVRSGMEPVDPGKPTGNLWIRGRGYRLTAGSQLTGRSYSQYGYGITAGVDRILAAKQSTNLVGLYVDMGNVDRDFANFGDGNSRGIALGAYGSWLAKDGWYGDAVLRVDRQKHHFDARAVDGNVTTGDYTTKSFGMSIEFGRRLERADGWWIEPYAQASLAWLGGADYDTTPAERVIRVSLKSTRSLQYRAAMRFGKQLFGTNWRPYGKFGVAKVDSAGGLIEAHDRGIMPDYDGWRVEAGAGVAYAINRWSQLYLDYEYAKANNYERPWSLNLGYRRLW